jgi:DNA mismatch repair protein MutL
VASINVLSPALASQIAAGEVVERPSSATKELIENALDARASRCDVSCVSGGVAELSVRDDGIGMSEEDAALCIERHATSKLKQISDLGYLSTFGFRGEALPSIASVSRFSLRTRPQSLDYGCRVDVVGGKASSLRREGMPVGTAVIVKDLFFNVPARRKFLRSTGTESAHISATVEGAALARPEVTFTLERDGRKVKEFLRAGSRRERVLQLLADEALTEVIGERGPLRLEAHLSRPERARPGTAGLWTLVNGRVVRDRMIAATVAQAYGAILASGTYPRGVVYLDLPSELVDVNVHPQKTEVRFVDARALGDAVFTIVSKTLGTAFNLPAAGRGARYQTRPPHSARIELLPVEKGFVPAERRAAERPAIDPWAIASPPAPAASIASNADPPQPGPLQRDGFPPDAPGPSLTGGVQNLAGAASLAAASLAEQEEPAPATMLNPPLESFEANYTRIPESSRVERASIEQDIASTPRLRFLVQVRLSMLVCEGKEGLYVLDQHEIHEQVLYAKYLAQYRSKTVRSETLLFPTLIQVQPSELALVDAEPELLSNLGFDLRIRGTDRMSIHAVPQVLKRASVEKLVHAALDELTASGRDLATKCERAIATLACRAAVRAGETVTSSEVQSILAELDIESIPARGKHGRPLLARLEWNELERGLSKHQ